MEIVDSRGMRASFISLAIACCAPSAIAGSQTFPFQAKFSISEAVNFNAAPPCTAVGVLTGTGTIALFPGIAVTAAAQDCVNPIGPFNPSAQSYQFSNPSVILDVNGEKVFVAYSGVLAQQSNAPHAIMGDFIIVGGTGRFAGATGGGALSGYEDISGVVTGQGQVSFDGHILFACQLTGGC